MFLKFDEIFRDAQLVSDDVNGARAALFEARRKALELEQENFIIRIGWIAIGLQAPSILQSELQTG